MTGDYGDDIEFNGGPSPDGRHLVYIDWETGNLAVRNLTSDQIRMITDDGYDPGYPLKAQVSPNGEEVAYSWARNEDPIMELRVVDLAGSSPRTLQSAQGVFSPSWSRDGRHIAAVFHDGENSGTEVAWVSAEDGSRTALATYPQTLMPQLSHSPDDRFVAVAFPVEEDSARSDIALLATDGSGLRPLVDHPADDWLIGWVPGTDELLFSSDRSGDRDLWAVRVDPDGNAEDLRPVSRGIGELNPMGFTEDGSLFYYNYTLQRNHGVAPFNENTGHIAMNEAEPILGIGSNQRPSWSPDGEHLAFVRRGPGKEETLYVRDMRTGVEHSVAEGMRLSTTGAPTWFPDGRSLLVLGKLRDTGVGEEEVQPAVYRVALTTGEAAHLFDLPATPNWPSSWLSRVGLVATVDGDGVIYHQVGGLVLHHLPSGQEEDLFRHPDLAANILALSPDGSELVFGISDPNAVPPDYPTPVFLHQGGRLMVIPAGGGEAREILRLKEPCQVREVSWTSVGHHIFLLQRDEEGTAIMRVPRDGGKVERMWEAQEGPGSWAPSPDGRRAAFWIQENEAEIWVMENLVAALKEKAGG
jgi:Tol biopolymer transport system component